MEKNILFLFCNTSSDVFFIDHEMRAIANNFKSVFVFISKQKNKKGKFSLGIPNIKVIEFDTNDISSWYKIKNIIFIFSKVFISELKIICKLRIKISFTIFKIMYIDFIKARRLQKNIKTFIENENININSIIFYSYWHDYKALMSAFIKRKQKNIIAISRSHGWDNFKNRHNPPYLPFKYFILQNLSQTFPISEVGKAEFLRYGMFNHKITVSRLGKDNNREPLIKKTNKNFHIVSCSNIIPVKRVNLIIDLLEKLNLPNITWSHFGDGYLRNRIQQYAKQKLTNCKFEFKGAFENKKILDFYAENYIDLFINVSEYEGIPVSIMEAISAGVPVLATNVGGTNEVINSKNGFLINEHFEISETANIIRDYLFLSKGLQEQYRKNAYNFWQENYNATRNYNEFYKMIVKF